MKFCRLIFVALILCLQIWPIFSAEVPPSAIEWPAGAEALIDKAIAIKVEAQQQHERMFSEGGGHGHAFVKSLDDLAQILAKHPQIREQLIEKEGADLKAKIALWSLDRKVRPEEYARMEHLHMSDNPIGKAVVERERAAKHKAAAEGKGANGKGMREGQMLNGRLLRRPHPKVNFPTGVSDDDKVERNRWVLEYLYFAPPTGNRELEMSSTRYILIVALKEISNEKSLVMLKFDKEVQIESFPDADRRVRSGTEIGYHARQILDFRSPLAFSIVASMIYHPGVRDNVRNLITEFTGVRLNLISISSNHSK